MHVQALQPACTSCLPLTAALLSAVKNMKAFFDLGALGASAACNPSPFPLPFGLAFAAFVFSPLDAPPAF